jgi:hypothetical protein
MRKKRELKGGLKKEAFSEFRHAPKKCRFSFDSAQKRERGKYNLPV